MLIFTILVAMAAAITRGIAAGQKRSLTATRIAGIDAALVQFVQSQRRLPCPANGTLASSAINAGVEVRNVATGVCTGNQQDGVVPWRTLGLSENDATDAWDRRLTYRAGPSLALDNGMDMSWCDPAGGGPGVGASNACNTACTSLTLATNCTPPGTFLGTKGLEIRDVAGNVTMNPNPGAGVAHTGAAYVVISPGESGGGGYLSTGTLSTSSAGDGTEEMKNYASLPNAGVATYYVDNALTETNDLLHFDDVVSRPSVLAVVTKAGLGPRSH